MIFKLAEAAEKSWRRLNGHNQLPKLILGVKFTDGIESRSSDRKLKPLPPDPFRHQDSAITPWLAQKWQRRCQKISARGSKNAEQAGIGNGKASKIRLS